MVSSKINKEVNYPEIKQIEEEDFGYDAPLFLVKLYGISLLIGLGKVKTRFEKKNILYYPIYIISNEKVKSQIGVYEIEADKMFDYLDDEKDLDIEKIEKPLLYSFVSKKYILKSNPNTEEYDDPVVEVGEKTGVEIMEEQNVSEAAEKEDDDDVLKLNIHSNQNPNQKDIISKEKEKLDKIIENGIMTNIPNYKPIPSLIEETEDTDKEIMQEFKESPKNNWIQSFLKNNNYKIIENEGCGDCFFAVIRDAFEQVGKKTTVQKLRALLAQNITEDIFQENRNLYLEIENNIQKMKNETAEMKKTHEVYKTRVKNAKTEEEKKIIIQQSMELNELYKKKKKEISEDEQYKNEYVGFMKNIKTFEDYQKYIQTSSYWADTWAISTLEYLLKIKLIILSQESYIAKANHEILNCGEINSKMNQSFNPEYYIITTYSGTHYELVSYKSKKILTFTEIPYRLKILVINKCLESNSGIYYLIQDFRNLKTQLGIDPNVGEPTSATVETSEVNIEMLDNEVVFMFYSNSYDAKPGKGSGEKIKKNKELEYLPLVNTKDWRRKLDDSWVVSDDPSNFLFTVDNLKWASVEHYLQGSKFKNGFPDFYRSFSLNYPTELSLDVSTAKNVGDITKTKYKSMRPVGIKVDADYLLGRIEKERKMAVLEKFKQNEELKNILLQTKNAILTHYVRGSPAEIDSILINTREFFTHV
jgi:hypothetical protein